MTRVSVTPSHTLFVSPTSELLSSFSVNCHCCHCLGHQRDQEGKSSLLFSRQSPPEAVCHTGRGLHLRLSTDVTSTRGDSGISKVTRSCPLNSTCCDKHLLVVSIPHVSGWLDAVLITAVTLWSQSAWQK